MTALGRYLTVTRTGYHINLTISESAFKMKLAHSQFERAAYKKGKGSV